MSASRAIDVWGAGLQTWGGCHTTQSRVFLLVPLSAILCWRKECDSDGCILYIQYYWRAKRCQEIEFPMTYHAYSSSHSIAKQSTPRVLIRLSHAMTPHGSSRTAEELNAARSEALRGAAVGAAKVDQQYRVFHNQRSHVGLVRHRYRFPRPLWHRLLPNLSLPDYTVQSLSADERHDAGWLDRGGQEVQSLGE